MKKTVERPDFASPLTLAYWKAAVSEIYNVRSLAVCAVLIAMRVALKGVYLPLGSVDVHVGFPINAVSGAICGPLLSLVSGAVSDILGFVLFPKTGGFMPLFTLVEMLCAFFYSILLYKARISLPRLLATKSLVNVVGNMIVNSIVMSISYGKGIYVYLIPRIAKNVLLLPVEVLILAVVFNAVTPLLVKMKFIPSPQEKMKFDLGTILFFATATVIVAALTYFFYDELYAFIKDFLTVG